MLYILYAVTLLAFAFVVIALVMGGIAMGGKKEGDRVKSNLWMRRRVTGQVVAITLLFLTFYVKRNGG